MFRSENLYVLHGLADSELNKELSYPLVTQTVWSPIKL